MAGDAELIALARYNAWANAKVFALCAAVDPPARAKKDVGYESIDVMLAHLVGVARNFIRMSKGGTPERPAQLDLASLTRRAAEIDREIEEFLATADEATLARTFDVPWFGFDVSVREAMLQALTHSQKHRADVCMVLGMLGVDVPGIDYIQMLAEERGAPG